MSNIFNGEEVICSIHTHKNIKKSTMATNVFANLISFGVSGRVTDDFKLILTNKILYIEASTLVAWGGLREPLYTEKILRDEIKYFDVKKVDTEEFIEIITNDAKTISLVRDNEKDNDLALVMSSLISKGKEN